MAEPDCPFCSPFGRLLEWSDAFAVSHTDPVSPGHTLVICKRHVADYFELSERQRAAVWATVAQVKEQLDRELNQRPDGHNVGFDVGAAAGPLLVTGGPHDPLLPRILPALDGATRVDLALAFIFDGGVNLLHDRLVDVLRRQDSRIRILTGDYQDVTEPRALRQLLQLPLIAGAHKLGSQLELKVYRVKLGGGDSFHPKAWILRGPQTQLAWVGSSNLSKSALETGVEWNYQIAAASEVGGVADAFEKLWRHPATKVVDDQWIDSYEKRRRVPIRGGQPMVVAPAEDAPTIRPEPREGIQSEVLLKLRQTRLEGNESGLVVLATGLGKTYVSAFDSREFARVLFVAHREEILTQALETFRKVRPDDHLGLYYGQEKDPSAAILFASVQTLASQDHLDRFAPDAFDYIVIDEFHHASATTYQRVLDHFRPKFMLGLTATPDRLDGVNLLALCDGNEVYRCGIPRGITDAQLAPFHYFGIGDDTEYEPIPWRSYTDERLGELVATTRRAQHALDSLREHTTGRVKALGFCVTIGHAEFMAEHFRGKGVDCAAVYTGSKAQRAATLDALATGEIEIVFCVDMFNEGVDVPNLDTVMMLRPTESSIVWLQQLGRGLRYVEGKTLTVLDFIGNHSMFLRRPELLFEALELVRQGEHAPVHRAPLASELPPGVEITFDLEAQDILSALREQAARGGSKAERWYRELRDLRGERPSALEAERAGWFKQLAKRRGGWFAHVAEEGDLTDAQRDVVEAQQSWFSALEGLEPKASHQFLVLSAVLHLDPFPGRVGKRSIAEWISNRARRSAAIMRELGTEGKDAVGTERLLDDGAFPELAALSGKFFVESKAHFDSSPLASRHAAALSALSRELVEHHLVTYLDKSNRAAVHLPRMLDDDGTEIDARFDVEVVAGQTTIVFHSRGGTKGPTAQNTEYRRGLATLLRRLSSASANRDVPPLDIQRIEVDSRDTKQLGQEQRTLRMDAHPFPVGMRDRVDHEKLALAIGAAAKRVGQAPGTKGGNDTRTIRITLSQAVPPGELWGMLRAKTST